VQRVRNGVKANYGDYSSQYEMVGGTRASERKPALAKQSQPNEESLPNREALDLSSHSFWLDGDPIPQTESPGAVSRLSETAACF
jgi:hypothetical protein